MSTIAIFGAGGGIGKALIQTLARTKPNTNIRAVSSQAQPNEFESNPHLSWQQTPHEIPALEALCEAWHEDGVVLDGVVSTIGWLHRDAWMPERRIEQLNEAQLNAYFHDNVIVPSMLLKALKPLFPKKSPSFFAQLSAKVGSIGDNELGGWYGYRASKAALNMMLKTAAIEFKRTHKQLVISSIHPGTTDTKLSEPFQERLPADKLFSAEQTAERMWDVIAKLKPEDSGGFWFWDGTRLPW
ncbi:MAG: short chain dehydrogenase [Idiomarinaceae bacterium HL-53]|nr:MAG: short chain dehydrogenase [Idiomarinaceae bacterium HL-53]CUS47961.1 NAD(P)-dependent dehydrogenase, short-chain alcohol dehydrogenase family [Idiomarinaceae bacterium HL-53]